MAATGAVIYIRAQFDATGSAARASGAVLFVPIRLLSGVWATTAVIASAEYSNLRAWLPPQGQPLVDADGRMVPTWYRFFRYVAETRLGGILGPTVPDVASGVVTALTNSAADSAKVVALSAQSQTNAEALSVVVQVAQNNALLGADQIPAVSRGYYELLP